jgi:hypothetical protein
MLNQLSSSTFRRFYATAMVAFCLIGSSEASAQYNRSHFSNGSYYSGLGGRVVNHSNPNFGGISVSGRQYIPRYPNNTWGPQYYQWNNWPTGSYQTAFPQNSRYWGTGSRVYSYGTGSYYGTRYQISQANYYNPYGQTRWYW